MATLRAKSTRSAKLGSVAGAITRRVRHVTLLLDAVRRLGLTWLLFRLRYGIAVKLRLLPSRSPLAQWPVVSPTTWRPAPIVATQPLVEWLLTHCDADRKAELLARVDDLRERRFEVFGTCVPLEGWHHDPTSAVTYATGVHWSLIGEFEEADIKRVWEPSRFVWALDLARAHIVLPESGAGELFWELFDEWCVQNPPNDGVNWACGQEASIRLMAVTLAAQAMPELISDARAARLRSFAAVTGARVAANIAYARSQKNNHHASEAVGLLTAAYWTDGHPDAPQWHRLGELHLLEVAQTLILPDGGSSQYSTNYHRVFVQNLMWAHLVYARSQCQVPAEITDALERAAQFLGAIVEPVSGSGPFFGPDDGGRLLSLGSAPHRDLADDCHVASAVANIECSCGCDQRSRDVEGLAWFGLEVPKAHTTDHAVPWVRSFPNVGLHILGAGSTRAYVRCGTYAFRPAHEDQLHCDVWIEGRNLAPDAGTQSYKPRGDEAGPLSAVSAHNSPHIPGVSQMPAVGRFLRARWAEGSVAELGNDEVHAYGSFRVTTHESGDFRRTVTVEPGRVRIEDCASDPRPFVSCWFMPVVRPRTIRSDGSEAATVDHVGMLSGGYGLAHDLDMVCVQSEGSPVVEWAFESQAAT